MGTRCKASALPRWLGSLRLPHSPQPRRRNRLETINQGVGPFYSIGVGPFYVVKASQRRRIRLNSFETYYDRTRNITVDLMAQKRSAAQTPSPALTEEGERMSSGGSHRGRLIYGSENSATISGTPGLPMVSMRSSKVFCFVSRISFSRVSTPSVPISKRSTCPVKRFIAFILSTTRL